MRTRTCKKRLCRVECISALRTAVRMAAVIMTLCLIIFLQGCREKPGKVNEPQGPGITDGAGTEDTGADDMTAGDAGKDADKVITVINEAAPDGTDEEDEGAAEADTVSDDKAYSIVDDFYITDITDDIFDRIYGISYKEDCTLKREDLKYLHVLHKDIDGNTLEGEMIVNTHIAEDVLDIFKELYENDYPIEKIRLVDEYGADDDKSMEDNNSSSFNYRTVPGSKKMSKHSMGLAIDINTRYNPYIRYKDGQTIITPVNGIEYADRERDFDYKIEKGDLCYDLFIGHGFTWGGEWKNSKDYQHFEIPDSTINKWYP